MLGRENQVWVRDRVTWGYPPAYLQPFWWQVTLKTWIDIFHTWFDILKTWLNVIWNTWNDRWKAWYDRRNTWQKPEIFSSDVRHVTNWKISCQEDHWRRSFTELNCVNVISAFDKRFVSEWLKIHCCIWITHGWLYMKIWNFLANRCSSSILSRTSQIMIFLDKNINYSGKCFTTQKLVWACVILAQASVSQHKNIFGKSVVFLSKCFTSQKLFWTCVILDQASVSQVKNYFGHAWYLTRQVFHKSKNILGMSDTWPGKCFTSQKIFWERKLPL